MADANKLSRRKALQTLSVLSVAGLAGCGSGDGGDGGDGGGDGGGGGGDGGGDGGDGGGDGGNLGERIPEPITVEYYADIGITSFLEKMAPVMTENLQAALESEINVRPVNAGTMVDNAVNDKRNSHFSWFYHSADPSRLDPEELIRRRGIDWAGANGRANLENYASCEYTEYADKQSTAADEETRQELVNQAQRVISEDVGIIPLLPYLSSGAYNSETVDAAGIGDAGINNTNPYVQLKSSPTDGDQLVINGSPPLVAFKNFYKQTASPNIVTLSTLIHSTLTEYDENLQLQPMLAEGWETRDNFREVEVTLRDAQFSNGDPITAEDVKFTYEHFWGNAGTYPYSNPPEEYAIEAVDDKTVVFTMGAPSPSILTVAFATWGIVNRQGWIDAGAEEDPGGFEPPLISSGPFEVSEWTINEFISMVPHDGHPVHNPDHGIDIVAYTEETTMIQAFMAGDLHIVRDIGLGAANQLEEDFPAAERVTTPSYLPTFLSPQFPMHPVKFREFRAAVGAAMDRELMNEVAAFGRSAPEDALYGTPFMSRHPWRAPEDMMYQMTDDVTGDPEKSKQLLRDQGWGWDGQGNLRLPAGADTSPLWPQGETPSPEDFPCLTGEGGVDFS